MSHHLGVRDRFILSIVDDGNDKTRKLTLSRRVTRNCVVEIWTCLWHYCVGSTEEVFLQDFLVILKWISINVPSSLIVGFGSWLIMHTHRHLHTHTYTHIVILTLSRRVTHYCVIKYLNKYITTHIALRKHYFQDSLVILKLSLQNYQHTISKY